MRCPTFIIVAFGLLALSVTACSTPNAEAPLDNQAHPAAYVLAHANDALTNLDRCTVCHGADFTGGVNAVSCVSCHANAPDFALHALPYLTAAAHGPSARLDQKNCLGCHGTAPNRFTGGIVADAALFNKPDGTCTTCHTSAGAHPTNWQGTNEDDDVTYASSHRGVTTRGINESCVLCHKVDAPGISPINTAPSCFVASYTNADGSSTGCHATGPGGSTHDIPYTSAQAHGAAAAANLAACQSCHGQTGTANFNGGLSAVGCNTSGCHEDADAHPTHWQGTNDPTPGYRSTHQTAGNQAVACALCHDYSQGRTAPNTSAPSCFSADYNNGSGLVSCHSSGPGVTHALPFLDGALHGPEAKADLSGCVRCHATPSTAGVGDNPRFNLAVGNMTNGCEDCHAAQTAHPTPVWAGGTNENHSTAGNLAVACALCHGTGLNGSAGGGIGPACAECHTAGSPLTLTHCTSCHNTPPDGQAPAGSASPNRDGAHGVHDGLAGVTGNCAACHTGAGNGDPDHFDTAAPADIAFPSSYNAQSGSAGFSAAGGGTCSNVRCHGGKTTPNWATGQINVAADCTDCHASGTGQYNSYNSGRHGKHLGNDVRLTCTDCHDPNRLANTHFTDLVSTGLDGDPGASIIASYNYNTANNTGCNISGCHGSEEWKK